MTTKENVGVSVSSSEVIIKEKVCATVTSSEMEEKVGVSSTDG